MKRFLYTEEHLDFLRQVAPGKFVYEIVELFNAKFGLNKTRDQMKSCMSNNHIHNGLFHASCPTRGSRNMLTTPEQDDAIRKKFHEKGSGTWRDVQKFLQDEYGLDFTLMQIKHILGTRKIRLGTYGRFQAGCNSPFKGKKHTPEALAKMSRTMFKPGNRPHNQLAIGTEIIDGMGYVRVKVGEPNSWKFKSHLIWEQETGETLKPNERIVFLDGNKLNLDFNNLAKVSTAELSGLNLSHGITEFADVTKANLTVVKLVNSIARRRKNDT